MFKSLFLKIDLLKSNLELKLFLRRHEIKYSLPLKEKCLLELVYIIKSPLRSIVFTPFFKIVKEYKRLKLKSYNKKAITARGELWFPSVFRGYFNQSLGLYIESPSHLRRIEKELAAKGQGFMSVDEYKAKQFESNLNKKKNEHTRIKTKLNKMFSKLKEGHSFYRENKEKGIE